MLGCFLRFFLLLDIGKKPPVKSDIKGRGAHLYKTRYHYYITLNEIKSDFTTSKFYRFTFDHIADRSNNHFLNCKRIAYLKQTIHSNAVCTTEIINYMSNILAHTHEHTYIYVNYFNPYI